MALTQRSLASEAQAHSALRDTLLSELADSAIPFVINGSMKQRLPGNVSLSFPTLSRDTLFAALADAGVAASSGSACSSHDVAPSHVLTAMGVPAQLAQQTLRIGLGRGSSLADIRALLSALSSASQRAA